MFLQFEFVDAGKLSKPCLAQGTSFVKGFSPFHKFEEVPLDSPCESLEFNLYGQDTSYLRGEDLKSEFAKKTLGSTGNASYHHNLKLMNPDNADQGVSLSEYVGYMAEKLAEDNGIPKEHVAVVVSSYKGDFKDVLKLSNGTMKSHGYSYPFK